MKGDIKNRLKALEQKSLDHVSRLEVVDYIGIEAYDNGDWQEMHHDSTITVFRNKKSGKVRGVYIDRRSDAELLALGGDLTFL